MKHCNNPLQLFIYFKRESANANLRERADFMNAANGHCRLTENTVITQKITSQSLSDSYDNVGTNCKYTKTHRGLSLLLCINSQKINLSPTRTHTPNKRREAHSNAIQIFGPKSPNNPKISTVHTTKIPRKVSMNELVLREQHQNKFNFDRWERSGPL